MTDHFELLDQPRSPWLDPEKLKQAFYAKSLREHPDARADQSGNSDDGFAQLNEAYQVLRDPKRRLQHLLALAGQSAAGKASAIPPDLEELFPRVAGLTREADVVTQKTGAASSALSLSLIQPELLRIRADVEEMLMRLRELYGAAEGELRTRDCNATSSLQDLYLRFSYLGRWIAELEEKKLRLAT
jgi:curved DNA-binding protein CbpA